MDPIDRADLTGSVARKIAKIVDGTASHIEMAQAKERSELLSEESGRTLGKIDDDSRP